MVVVSCVQALTYSLFTTLAARNLHNKMFDMVLRAPMAFFERNPVGGYPLYVYTRILSCSCWIAYFGQCKIINVVIVCLKK